MRYQLNNVQLAAQQRLGLEEDHLRYWMEIYISELIIPESGDEKKTRRLLTRFIEFFERRYGHDRLSTVMKRDVEGWLGFLFRRKSEGGMEYSPNYVNSHQSVLSGWFKWLRARAPHLVQKDPTAGVRTLHYVEPEGRALTDMQVLSLKNISDRLERFHVKKDRRRHSKTTELREYARPMRDRAIVYVLLGSGLRREELVRLDLEQLKPSEPEELRKARGAKLHAVRGKGKTVRTVYLTKEARQALADYLEIERPKDAGPGTTPLFLSACGLPKRNPDGRLHPRRINGILEQIGRWHDAEFDDPRRHISPLTPHDLRHTFGNMLKNDPAVSKQDFMNLMGWRNEKQIPRYTLGKDDSYFDMFERMDKNQQ